MDVFWPIRLNHHVNILLNVKFTLFNVIFPQDFFEQNKKGQVTNINDYIFN